MANPAKLFTSVTGEKQDHVVVKKRSMHQAQQPAMNGCTF